MTAALQRWSGPASLAAGVLWLAVWWHQRLAHGTTQVNEMQLVAGLTWMDTGKLFVPILLLVVVGLAGLWQPQERSGPLGRLGRLVAFGGLGFLIVTTAMEFWTFPWGSYAITFEEATGLLGSNTAGAIQSLASLVFTIGLGLWSVDLARARVIPSWIAPILVVGGLTTVFLSPSLWMPAAAWLILGAFFLRKQAAVGRPRLEDAMATEAPTP